MKEKRKAFYKVCFSYWYHDLCKKVCRSDMLCPSVVSSYLYGALGAYMRLLRRSGIYKEG